MATYVCLGNSVANVARSMPRTYIGMGHAINYAPVVTIVNNGHNYSTNNINQSSDTSKSIEDQSKIKKSVFISQSYDVFTNLALEDWIYKKFDFSNHHVLMLWANDPCVVIGRHQNPFMEANVSQLTNDGVLLARRNSGGGTVFHDRGNLNCTFFTPRERYNRMYNLKILTRAMFREYGIKSEISARDDIVVQGKKVSTSKLYEPTYLDYEIIVPNSDNVSTN